MASYQMVSRVRDKQLRILNLDAANQAYAIPKGHAITAVYYRNRTANAVTGGLKIGTTVGGTDIVAAQTISGSSIGHVAEASILKRLFSLSASQTLYIDAVSAWNSAAIDLFISLDKCAP